MWLEGDLYREKLSEQENGSNKMATVTGILSGVDDISINDCNKSRPSRKAGSKLVSLRQAVEGPCIRGVWGGDEGKSGLAKRQMWIYTVATTILMTQLLDLS